MIGLQVHDLAILINSAPKVMLYAFLPSAELYEDLVQKVSIPEAGVAASKTLGKLRAELVDPESNGFVTDGNIALG